ncbi:hypothetical protein ACWDA7_34745 [Streptomyces sp. NPDC001156]
MTRLEKRLAGFLLALVVVAVVVYAAVHGGGGGTAGLDKRSYKAGYDSLRGANLPPSVAGRRADEAQCDISWRSWANGVNDADTYDRHSWVVGCADYLEFKKSRF